MSAPAITSTRMIWAGRLTTVSFFLTLIFPILLVIGRAPADIAATGMAVMLLGRSWLGREFAWSSAWWLRACLAIWIVLLVSSALGGGLPAALAWIRWPLFAAAVALLLIEPRYRRWVMWSILATVLFVAADTLFQFFVGHDVFGIVTDTPGRMTGPLRRIVVGIYITFSSAPAIAYFFSVLGRKNERTSLRLASVLAVSLIILAVVASGERMSLLLLGLEIVTLAAILLPWRRSLISTLIFVSFVVGGALLAAPSLLERQKTVVGKIADPHKAGYVELWQAALSMYADNPVLGIGLRQFRLLCPEHLPAGLPVTACNLHPHQIYIEWLAETGTVGLLAFLVLGGLLLMKAFRHREVLRAHPLVCGGAAAMFTRLWPFATSSSFFSNWNEGLFWFSVGLAMTVCHLAGMTSATPAKDD